MQMAVLTCTPACVMSSLSLFVSVLENITSHPCVCTTGVYAQHILVPVLPHKGDDFVNGDVPLLWADTACCLT